MLLPQDFTFMTKAVALAKRGLYTTMPNPRVGCLLARDDVEVASAWHAVAGDGHAEALALQSAVDAGQVTAGLTAYVTLEPCSHTGKTGPCADALIAAGVRRVVYGMQDPNPQVSGRGLEKLVAAGIEVAGPCLESECRALNPGFIMRMQQGRPLVRCKLAMSLDGRTAMASGDSQWITSADARSDVQRLRARSCAIVTGIGSILQDDSSLTLRVEELRTKNSEQVAERQPWRVILDSNQRLPIDSKVLQYRADKTCVVSAGDTARPEIDALGATQCHFGSDLTDKIDLDKLLNWLVEQQCNEVLVEAGSELAGAFLKAGLLDEIIIYMAPKLMGSTARPLFDLPLEHMTQQVPLQIVDVRAVGCDWRITVQPDVTHS